MEEIREIERMIGELQKTLSKEEEDLGKLEEQIKRLQKRKKTLESKRSEDLHTLEEMTNKRIVLTMENRIGQLDDSKLSALAKILDEFRDEIVDSEKEEKEEDDTYEEDRATYDTEGV